MEVVKIHKQIDAHVLKCLHTTLVIAIGVNVVYTNRICAEILHLFGIARALLCIDQWVVGNKLISNSYRSLAKHHSESPTEFTFDVELLPIAIKELVSKRRYRRNGNCVRNQAGQQSECGQHPGRHCCRNRKDNEGEGRFETVQNKRDAESSLCEINLLDQGAEEDPARVQWS